MSLEGCHHLPIHSGHNRLCLATASSHWPASESDGSVGKPTVDIDHFQFSIDFSLGTVFAVHHAPLFF